MNWLAITLLVLILIGQAYLVKKVRRIMVTFADVQAAQTALLAGVDQLITQSATQNAQIAALQAQIADGQAVTPEQLQTIIDQDTAEIAKITASLPAPPAPPAPPPLPIDPTTGVTVIPLTAEQLAAGQAPTPAQSAAFPPDGATIPTDLQRIAAKHLASGTLPIDPTTGKQVVPLTRPQLDAGLAPTETQLAMFPPDGGTVKP